MLIQTPTLEIFRVYFLTAGLMLKLIVLAESIVTEGAIEHSPSVFPHCTLTFNTHWVGEWTDTCVGGQASSTVAHPRFTEVTNGTLQEYKSITQCQCIVVTHTHTHTHTHKGFITQLDKYTQALIPSNGQFQIFILDLTYLTVTAL